MTSNEDILRAIMGVDGKLDRFITSMVGNLDHENPQGRVPRLEADSENYEERIKGLEDSRLRLVTIASVVSTIAGWFFDYVFHPFKH